MALYNLLGQLPPSKTSSIKVAEHVEKVWGINIYTNLTTQQRKAKVTLDANNKKTNPEYKRLKRKWANYR
jgi:hypothetical protein